MRVGLGLGFQLHTVSVDNEGQPPELILFPGSTKLDCRRFALDWGGKSASRPHTPF